MTHPIPHVTKDLYGFRKKLGGLNCTRPQTTDARQQHRILPLALSKVFILSLLDRDCMAIWNGRSNRKSTGGRYVQSRKKKRFEVGRERQFTFLGPHSIKLYRTKGSNAKSRVLAEDYANVTDRKTGVTKKAKIVTVKQNPANPNYTQRNIMNKGAVIQTEIGLALITSRPGQHGMINAILLPSESK